MDYLNFHHLPNLLYFNIDSIIEALFYTIIFLPIIINRRKIEITFIISVLLTLTFIISTFYSGGIFQYNTIFEVTECVFLIIISGFLLLKIMTLTSIELKKNNLFWFGSGLLIYFTLSLTMFVVQDINVKNNSTLLSGVLQLYSLANIIANIFYAIAFLCRTPQAAISKS